MCPLTGLSGLLQAQVITVETRMNIFGPEKWPISLWRATDTIQEESLPDSLIQLLLLLILLYLIIFYKFNAFQILLRCRLQPISPYCLVKRHLFKGKKHEFRHTWKVTYYYFNLSTDKIFKGISNDILDSTLGQFLELGVGTTWYDIRHRCGWWDLCFDIISDCSSVSENRRIVPQGTVSVSNIMKKY